jgi:hypothetical protein
VVSRKQVASLMDSGAIPGLERARGLFGETPARGERLPGVCNVGTNQRVRVRVSLALALGLWSEARCAAQPRDWRTVTSASNNRLQRTTRPRFGASICFRRRGAAEAWGVRPTYTSALRDVARSGP